LQEIEGVDEVLLIRDPGPQADGGSQ
jgi:hypothetical protein